MIRIGAHLSGLERQLLQAVSKANAQAAASTLRLATGERVQNAGDDPAAFVRISQLKAELASVNSTASQVEKAVAIAAGLQSTVDQVRTQLNAIRAELVTDEDGSLSGAERTEAQATIDAALAQIDLLAGATIEGRSRLDGSGDYVTTGRNASQVTRVKVFSTAGSAQSIDGEVTTAATQATLTHTGASGQATADAELTLTGSLGSATISVTNGEDLADVADRINAVSHKAGVTAAVDGDNLDFTSVDYGTASTIAVEVTSGTFATSGGNGDGTAAGSNAVVTINGEAVSTVQGNRVSYARNGFHFQVELAAGFTGTLDTISVSDEQVARFTLSTDLARTTALGLGGLGSHELGGVSGRLSELASGGSLAGLDGNTSAAIRVVDEALADLELVSARVDGFAENSVASSAALLNDLETTLTTSLEAENGVDTTVESLQLAKFENQASLALASLNILQQQQSSMVEIVRLLAGLR